MSDEDRPAPIRRISRPIKIGIQLGVLAVILASVATVGFIEYSAQPGFCDNCHLMVPYYESWATSSHNDVPCIKCHYAPGIKAEAMGKLQAANQVVKYLTGAYGTKPWAEIEDAACLRSGCHVTRTLEGEVDFLGVRFDHTEHLGELRHGIELRCTSCHSQIVQGEHLTVTRSTCYLCHFDENNEEDAVTTCTRCHVEPERFTSTAGLVVDHPQYVEDLVSCVSCHDEVVAGTGFADEARCFNCHNEPERLEQFVDIEAMHRIHIADRNIECTQCHLPIEHRIISLAETFELDCASCHVGTHEAQQLMYAGRGGHGTEDAPSSMFLASVSCKGCHELPAQMRGHEEVNVAGEASCMSCHGTRYANILPAWKTEMDRRVALVERVVENASGQAGAAPVRARRSVDSLLALAADNVALVRVGRSAHNITYADQLIRTALDQTKEAVRIGRLPYAVGNLDLGPEIGETACLQCHLGVERRDVYTEAGLFSHEAHVPKGALACAECHTPIDDHGGTLPTEKADCTACHHGPEQPATCARCHLEQVAPGSEVIPMEQGDFSHDIHSTPSLSCADCHVAPEMTLSTDCASCHQPHHQPEATCISCHQSGVRANHERSGHVRQCTECHGPPADLITHWTPSVCMACHVEKVDHWPDRICQDCHRIPDMGSGPAANPAHQPDTIP